MNLKVNTNLFGKSIQTCLVWFGLVWFGLVWFGLVWFGLVWFGLVWFGLGWFGLVWFGLVWFDLFYFSLRWKVTITSETPLQQLVATPTITFCFIKILTR